MYRAYTNDISGTTKRESVEDSISRERRVDSKEFIQQQRKCVPAFKTEHIAALQRDKIARDFRRERIVYLDSAQVTPLVNRRWGHMQ